MRTTEIIRNARNDGRRAGKAAASWAFDGNTSDETYARVLRGIDDGDPEVLDSLREPNLSGEWADDPTPRTLQDDYAVSDARWESIGDDVCDAWECAARDTFWAAIEETGRIHQ